MFAVHMTSQFFLLLVTTWQISRLIRSESAGSLTQGGDGMVRFGNRALLFVLLLVLFIPVYLLLNHSDQATIISKVFTNDVHDANDDLSYGVIMDAGSTGTRLFLYCWTSTSDRELINIRSALEIDSDKPVIRKVSPGLSTFADKPDHAADYIKPLLDYAIQHIPASKRQFTPVFLLATAGMRLVPQEKQTAIMRNLHTQLPTITEMQVMKEHIRVIEGKFEGIYSWIAVNYILGKFQNGGASTPTSANTADVTSIDTLSAPPSKPLHRNPTVGMIDMGGASVQIGFEMSSNESFRSENVENINLGCHDEDERFKYKLFVTTFLGFGVNEGLRKYEQRLSDRLQKDNGSYVRDECLPINLQKNVQRDDGTAFVRKGSGDWPSCVNELSEIILKDDMPVSCSPRCFFGTVSAPMVDLSEMDFYGFSEYWYSVEDVLGLGGAYDYDLVSTRAKKFCSQRWSEIQTDARKKLYPKADEDRLRTQCFKSAWVNAVLHNGFAMSKTRNKFKSAFTIEGQEIQWALGAMIYHMRYFPLRSNQNNVISSKHPVVELSSSFSPLNAICIILLVVLIVYVCFALFSKSKPDYRREKSMWNYVLMAADEPIVKTTFRFPSYA